MANLFMSSSEFGEDFVSALKIEVQQEDDANLILLPNHLSSF